MLCHRNSRDMYDPNTYVRMDLHRITAMFVSVHHSCSVRHDYQSDEQHMQGIKDDYDNFSVTFSNRGHSINKTCKLAVYMLVSCTYFRTISYHRNQPKKENISNNKIKRIWQTLF